MTLNLHEIGVIPKRYDKWLGIRQEIDATNGLTLGQLAKTKDYVKYHNNLKGNKGDTGVSGVMGDIGVEGDNAYLLEKDLLNVNSLASYLNLFSEGYYSSMCDQYLQCFISYWDTRKTDFNSTLSNQIELPFLITGIYDAIVFWGDGCSTIITEGKPLIHSYEVPGIYKIIISGDIEGFSFRDARDRHKIMIISNWGGLTITENVGMFRNCSNLNIIANNKPNFKNVTSFQEYFANCSSLTTVPNIQTWPWVEINNISSMFTNCFNLIEDLSFIDVNNFDYSHNFGV
jgi:hypothetical protein